MATNRLPDIKFVRECLNYDPDSGIFTWRERPRSHFPSERIWRVWNGNWAGKVAGHKVVANADRIYWRINLGGMWKAHRIAWLMVYGEPVPDMLDHINRDACDNRIANIREVTQSQNAMNQSQRTRNTTTNVKGVFRHSKRYPKTPYVAHIAVDRKRIHLGYFSSLEEAIEARQKAGIAYFGPYWSDVNH